MRTISSASRLLRPRGQSVFDTLYHKPGGPEFGQSYCSFRNNLEPDYLSVTFASYKERNICNALLRTISGPDTLTLEIWDAMTPHFVQNVSPASRKILCDRVKFRNLSGRGIPERIAF